LSQASAQARAEASEGFANLDHMADVVVIGGGIAGVSAAAYFSESLEVVLLEAEPVLAFHTTGRSAALYYPGYGHSSLAPLSEVSGEFFRNPEYTDHALLSPRGVLVLERFHEEASVPEGNAVRLDAAQTRDMLPVINETVRGSIWEPDPMDLDVAGLHQAFVRKMRSNGGVIHSSARVSSLRRSGGRWSISYGESRVAATYVVNAAGAWADQVAVMAGLSPVGLIAKRRTAFMVQAPEESASWPLTHDVDTSFYFRPDGVQLMCSLADETPSEPCDAKPREVDVALAIERINAATTLAIRSVGAQWAGLRTFAPDGGMVIGEDPEAGGFFWLAGQGGTGIQTAPAAGRLVAELVMRGSAPADLEDAGLDLREFAPGRFL